MTGLLVAAGGAVGAMVRWAVDRMVSRWITPVLPWGTLTVNVLASTLAGSLAGAGLAATASWAWPLLGTGLAGALSTFSTFGYETVRLAEDGAWSAAAVNVTVSVVVGVAAAAGGWWLGTSW